VGSRGKRLSQASSRFFLFRRPYSRSRNNGLVRRSQGHKQDLIMNRHSDPSNHARAIVPSVSALLPLGLILIPSALPPSLPPFELSFLPPDVPCT
jgi:hypothetical protein